jgi:hypothetical protein
MGNQNKVVKVKKEGCFLNAYDDDAILLHQLLGYTVFEFGNQRRMKTGFPIIGFDTVYSKLKKLGYDLIKDISSNELPKRNQKNHTSKRFDYVEFCKGLLNGVDTRTGEVLEKNNIILSTEVQKLLKELLIKMENQVKKKSTYVRNGAPWDDAEVEQLKTEYLSKTPIKEMSAIHQRTSGAIRSRLLILFPEIFDKE